MQGIAPTFSQRLIEWTTKQKCKGDPWGPTRLSKATGIPVGWWGNWLKGYTKLRLTGHAHPSDLNPNDAQWDTILNSDQLPGEFRAAILPLAPGAPASIGRKECAYCGRHHAHPYLLKWCSVECKSAAYDAQLWAHDAAWRERHQVAAAKRQAAG